MTAKSSRITALDGLRGITAIYIAVHHLCQIQGTPLWAFQFARFAYLAVPVFFVISGFVVFRSLEARVGREHDWRLHFYVRRFLRIVPLWWLVVLTCGLWEGWDSWIILANLSFAYGFLSFEPKFMPIDPAWSLFVEEIFYLLLPLFFTYVRNVVVLLLTAVFMTGVAFVWTNGAASWGVSPDNHFIYRSPLALFQLFLWGGLLGIIYGGPTFHKILSFVSRRPYAMEIGSALILSGALFALFVPFNKIWIPSEIPSLLFVLAVLFPNTIAHRLCSCRVTKWLGVRCYFIYIAHDPLRMIFDPFWGRAVAGAELSASYLWAARTSILLFGTLILAKLSWTFFEKPCLDLAGAWRFKKVTEVSAHSKLTNLISIFKARLIK